MRNNLSYIYIAILIVTFSNISYSQKSLVDTHGTIVICITRNDTLWIGVDSKKTSATGEDMGLTCKVLITPNFVFASAGLNESIDTSFGKPVLQFNVDSLVLELSRKGFSTSKVVNLFIKRVSDFLESHVAKSKSYWEKYKIGEPIKEAGMKSIFADYYKNQIRIVYLRIFAKRTGEELFDIIVDPKIKFSKMGDSINIPIICEPPGLDITDITIYSNETIVEGLKIALTQIINTGNKEIGFPINIVRVDKSGFHWEDKHPPCK